MKHDLRTHLALLEREGLLQWVDQEVDKDWEITCVTRLFFQRNSAVNRKALGFRRVKGYDISGRRRHRQRVAPGVRHVARHRALSGRGDGQVAAGTRQPDRSRRR